MGRVILLWTLWAKTPLIMMPLRAVSGLLVWRKWHRTAWAVFITGTIIIFYWLTMDIQTRRLFGRHVLSYREYLGASDLWEWAGGMGAVLTPTLILLAVVLAAVVGIAFGSGALVRAMHRKNPNRGSTRLSILLAILLLGIVPMQRIAGDKEQLTRFAAA